MHTLSLVLVLLGNELLKIDQAGEARYRPLVIEENIKLIYFHSMGVILFSLHNFLNVTIIKKKININSYGCRAKFLCKRKLMGYIELPTHLHNYLKRHKR